MASEPINGAYTELFAGLSDTITKEDNGQWGRFFTHAFAIPEAM